MTDTMFYTGTLKIERCPTCNIPFAFPMELERKMRDDASVWRYCPNGHTFHYDKGSEMDKLRQQLAREKRNNEALAAAEQHQREQRQHVERRLIAAKGQATKLRKRAAAGVCPCCNRTFEQLARHMATQHPAYVETAPA